MNQKRGERLEQEKMTDRGDVSKSSVRIQSKANRAHQCQTKRPISMAGSRDPAVSLVDPPHSIVKHRDSPSKQK